MDNDPFAGGPCLDFNPDGSIRTPGAAQTPCEARTPGAANSNSSSPVRRSNTYLMMPSRRPRSPPEEASNEEPPHQRHRNDRQGSDGRSPADRAGGARAGEPSGHFADLVQAVVPMLRQWLMDKHWVDAPCEHCAKKGWVCERPDADSGAEKCKQCSDPKVGKPCSKKWILERSSVGKMVKMYEAGQSLEDANWLVYCHTGKLGGPWDRCKSYPGRSMGASGVQTGSASNQPRNQPRSEGRRLRSADAAALGFIEGVDAVPWPPKDQVEVQGLIKGLKKYYAEYKTLQPEPSDKQMARIGKELAQSMWQAFHLPGNLHDERHF